MQALRRGRSHTSNLLTPDSIAEIAATESGLLQRNYPLANVLGVGVHAINMDQAIEAIESALKIRHKGYVCVTGVHGVMEAQRDAAFRSILNAAFLNVPDGMPTVWIGKFQGCDGMDRVFGPDLMLRVCQASQQKGYRHFLCGGAPGVAEALKDSLQARCPRLQIVGTFTPPFHDWQSNEEDAFLRLIDRLEPDLVWVGLSTPKQERFMAEYIHKLNTTLMIGVGAAFDFHTDRLKDAPSWMKQSGLQWVHRLLQDPRRLGKRYLRTHPKFLLQITLQLLGREMPLS
jgi:N-acetylglucosaminyldiphosphoundecaprenol N-acetyl-beta-D-mannosaminyltransferase